MWTHTQFAKKLKNADIKIISNDGRLITKKKIQHISDKNEKICLRNKYNLPVDEFIGLINFDKKNVNIKGYDLLKKILTKLNKLNKIEEFDPLTADTFNKFDLIKLYANSHYITPKPTMDQAIKEISKFNLPKFRLC